MTGERPRLRLLHTSDVHIGDDPIQPGARLDSFKAVVDAALEQDVDAVLIAGDLFDNARIEDDVVAQTIKELSRLRQPTIVIPGNHDCVDKESLYLRVDLREAGPHIHFVGDPAGQLLVFENLGMSVWARGIEEHHPGHKPLAGYTAGDPQLWRIGLTHGHFVPRGEEDYRSSTILEDEIAQLECDYLALGHWHRFVDVSAEGVTAFYCGSPGEEISVFPSANLVTLDPVGGVIVDRIPLRKTNGA